MPSPLGKPPPLPNPNLLEEKMLEIAVRLDGKWSDELSGVAPVVLFLGSSDIGLPKPLV